MKKHDEFDGLYMKGITPKNWNDLGQAKRDRQALIDVIRTGMVQRLDDGVEPKLSRPVREAVKILMKERFKNLKGIAMTAPKRAPR